MTKELPPSPLPERWFDVLCVRVGDRRRARDIRREITANPPPDLFGVTGAEPTEFERRVIAASAEALTAWLAGMGFVGRPVAADRVHLLTPEEYRAKIGSGGPDGLTMYGHVYLQRTDDEARLIHMTTHELVHQAAFLSLEAIEVRDEATGETAIGSGAKRGGLAVLRRQGVCRTEFQGWNEGVTELIAHEVRRVFIGLFGPIDDRLKDKLLCFWAYSYLSLLAAKLIRAVTGARTNSPQTDWPLYRDYFCGTSGFLEELRRIDPRAPAILRDMDDSVGSALAAARQLGFDQAAERIAKLVRP